MRQFLFMLLVAVLSLPGCGGGGGGGGSNDGGSIVPASHSVQVVVTGLDGSAELSNGSDRVTVSSDGTYILSQDLSSGSQYSVTVTSQPATQTCAVMNPSGVVSGSDIDDIFVNCAELTAESIVLDTLDTSYLLSVAADSLTFSELPASFKNVSAGDVIFSEQITPAPDGLLRKVVSVEQMGGQTVIHTEEGVLTDLIQKGGFSYKGNISAQWAAINPQGIRVSPHTVVRAATSADSYCSGKPSDFVFDFNNQPISEDIAISGCTGFNLDLDAGAQVGLLGELESFHFIVDSTVSQALSISVKSSVNTSQGFSIEYDVLQKSLAGKKLKFPAPIPIGPIIIPAGVEVDLFVALSGSLEASTMVGAGASMTVKAGARFTNGVFQVVRQFDPKFEIIGPEIDGNVQLRAAFGPEVAYKIAGAAGPELAFSLPYLDLTAGTTLDPWWRLDLGTNATLALTAQINKIKGLGWLSDKWGFDYQLGEIYDFSRTIAQAQGPYGSGNSAPTAQFNTSPALPQVDQVVTFTNLSTDPDGDALTWYWSFGDGTTSALKNPTHSFVIEGNYQVTLEVTDPDGATDTLTKNLNIIPPADQHTVTASAGIGGSVTPTNQIVNSGSTASFTISPNSGYSRNNPVDGTCANGSWNVNTYTTGAITSDCSVVFSFSANQSTPGPVLNPGNGHYYEFVGIATSWAAAKTEAESRSHNGLQGYLVNITSSAENTFVANLLESNTPTGGLLAWIGGTNPSGTGQWVWTGGPEAGTAFWTGDRNGSPVNGAYINWEASSPSQLTDNYSSMFSFPAQNFVGYWGTERNGPAEAYIVEYGGDYNLVIINAGIDQTVPKETKVYLDGEISRQYPVDSCGWTQISGTIVNLIYYNADGSFVGGCGDDRSQVYFLSPNVATNEILEFEFEAVVYVPDETFGALPKRFKDTVLIAVDSGNYVPPITDLAEESYLLGTWYFCERSTGYCDGSYHSWYYDREGVFKDIAYDSIVGGTPIESYSSIQNSNFNSITQTGYFEVRSTEIVGGPGGVLTVNAVSQGEMELPRINSDVYLKRQ